MNGRVTTLLTMLAAATVMLSTIGAQPATRYIWNASESVPVGLYLVRPTARPRLRAGLTAALDRRHARWPCKSWPGRRNGPRFDRTKE